MQSRLLESMDEEMFQEDENSQIVEQRQIWPAQRALTQSDIALMAAVSWLAETASTSVCTP
jgi:hypothetical protein